MIETRVLGPTGLTVSALGFGVSGPLGMAATTARDVKRLVDAAVAGGVTLFDTAPFYGVAETRLGDALKGRDRSRLVVCTKAGKRRVGGRLMPAFAPAEVEASAYASLKTLHAERLDILLLHGPGRDDLTDALWDKLEDLQRRGAIGAFGVCARAWSPSRAAVAQLPAFSDDARHAARDGGGVLGIEAMRGAAPGVRASLRPADLWYSARAVLRKTPRSELAPSEALSRALALPHLASVLVTTTRVEHLHANIETASRIRPPSASSGG